MNLEDQNRGESITQTWTQVLRPFAGAGRLFDDEFIEQTGSKSWQPNDEDRAAAATSQVQLISRIATQPLTYLDGDEKAALKSLHDLFGEARDVCAANLKAKHFRMLTWHVLNVHVRPVTAKWHPRSERGLLSALDSSDEFRGDLERVQFKLRQFRDLLGLIETGAPNECPHRYGNREHDEQITREMAQPLPWGILKQGGGMRADEAGTLNEQERDAIGHRRKHYGREGKSPDKPHAVALALSGGGIRSATFSLGVLVALARRGLMPQFDYLSTVSGGGYLGSFLTALMNTPTGNDATPNPPLGLGKDDNPFQHTNGESQALRHLRHYSKYLAAGSWSNRLQMVGAQLFGMLLNGLSVVLIAAAVALAEISVRWGAGRLGLIPPWGWVWAVYGIVALTWSLIALALYRYGRPRQQTADRGLVVLLLLGVGLTILWFARQCHGWVDQPRPIPKIPNAVLVALPGVLPVLASLLAGLPSKSISRAKVLLGVLSAAAAPLFVFGIYLALYQCQVVTIGHVPGWPRVNTVAIWLASIVGVLVAYFTLLNVNLTSPHRHYRRKLAEAYLIWPTPGHEPAAGPSFEADVPLKLSDATSPRGPYHLINAALNVPASKNPGMQGRLADFFLFTRHVCGSPLTGYVPTTEWEKADAHFDLGTAMAVSGAAVAPQLGLGTNRRLSFWLTLLNIRLGYWLRNPACYAAKHGKAPGLTYLWKEMFGTMHEHDKWLFLTDGGHIENLGVYELLRRRCKFIVAIDGEQDERMTFAALTTLQRLAAIDLDTRIDVNLDDLRLNQQGLSRSHFRFCRIDYPHATKPGERQTGYLLYLKLSLTGNEGEFLRRYRLDEPVFPHHSTADQMFSETQFEAYRGLGEHIGDKLFLPTLVGQLSNSTDVNLEEWFLELGKRLLASA